jgi:thiol-disulfide isomerase/thioredoxin
MTDELEAMRADPEFDVEEHADAVDALSRDGLRFLVWGGDWCGDCRRQLPGFAAALAAADVPAENVRQYPVEKTPAGKVGPRVDEYGVERIPTVVVEHEGREVARFVEDGDEPVAVALAAALREADVVA